MLQDNNLSCQSPWSANLVKPLYQTYFRYSNLSQHMVHHISLLHFMWWFYNLTSSRRLEMFYTIHYPEFNLVCLSQILVQVEPRATNFKFNLQKAKVLSYVYIKIYIYIYLYVSLYERKWICVWLCVSVYVCWFYVCVYT